MQKGVIVVEIKDAQGFWSILSGLELKSIREVQTMLQPFLRTVVDCYECGVEVPTLPRKQMGRDTNITIAALFLKRSLNDLRATWILLLSGYTSQAGSVAAAGFENAMVVCCLTNNTISAEKLFNIKSAKLRLSVAKLCKLHYIDISEGKNIQQGESEVENWEVLYSQYQWLCKVKHPTIPSAAHDALATSMNKGEFAIMAAPDTRIEDLPNKAFIISVLVMRVVEAIAYFGLKIGINSNASNVIAWRHRMDSMAANLKEALNPVMKTPLPFSYDGGILRK
jgi:hypothetical protein